MFVHGNNLEQKETHQTKYRDNEALQYLQEIRIKYNEWKSKNLSLIGPMKTENKDADFEIIKQRVSLLNEYKNFINQQHYAEKFDSRSNLHSSVLEEFMYYLFKDIISEYSDNALIGKAHAFKDIFFRADNYELMIKKVNAKIEIKDHDFTIGVRINATMNTSGYNNTEKYTWDIPAIAIECKTYLDKTMLQDASTAAEELKHRNPNAMYIVVAEWLKLTDSVNLKKFKIDQIYVIRKQKNTDREFRYEEDYVKNPIYHDVIFHLFSFVRDFLTKDWETGIDYGLSKGYLI
jgi:hypothetical protein